MSADVTPAPGAEAPPVGGIRDRPVVGRLIALLIVASWVAWAVPAWQSSLHEVRPHELIADIEAERVVGYLAVENVRRPSMSWMGGLDSDYDWPAADTEGRPELGPPRQLLYTLDGGRTRLVQEAPVGLPDGTDIFDSLLASGARPFWEAGAPANRDWAAYPGLFMTGLFIVSLIGRPTRWGTKPFWVLVASLAGGLGVLAYAVRELAAGPPSRSGAPRLRWFHGLVIAVVGALLLPSLLGLLH